MRCRHCGAAAVSRPRGLCWTCYYAPEIRDRYPRRFASPVIGDRHGGFPLPPAPTEARPGTPEKIDVLQHRALAHWQLFHPADASIDDELRGLGVG